MSDGYTRYFKCDQDLNGLMTGTCPEVHLDLQAKVDKIVQACEPEVLSGTYKIEVTVDGLVPVPLTDQEIADKIQADLDRITALNLAIAAAGGESQYLALT